MNAPVLFHGTRQAFSRGGWLFPPAITGAPMRDSSTLTLPPGWVDDRDAYVYVTPDADLAWDYAETAPGRGRPRLLEVEPMSPLEPDVSTVNGELVEAYRCTSARVTAVVRDRA